MSKVEYEISLRDKNFSSTIDHTNNKVNGLEASLSRIGIAAAAAFSLNAITSFMGSVVEVGAQFDSYETSLSTLLGSAQAGSKAFENIKKDAQSTPFDTESLIVANRALIGAGESAESSRKTVLDLANTIAATGGNSENLKSMAVNLNQIRSIGKASALDIKQFVYAGIPIYELLAKATGKNSEEVKKMDVSYDLLAKTLDMAYKGANGVSTALDSMSKSTSGQLSNLGDAVVFLKDDIYEYLKPEIQSLISTMSDFILTMKDGLVWIKEHATGLKAVAVSIGIAGAALLIYTSYQKIAAWYTGLSTAAIIINTLVTEGLAGAMVALNIAMAANPVGLIIVGIAALGGLMYYLWNKVDSVRGALVGLWEAGKQIFINLWEAGKQYLGGLADLLVGIFTLDIDKIKKGLSGAFNGMKNAYTGLGEGAGKAFSKGWDEGVAMGKDPDAPVTNANGAVTSSGANIASSVGSKSSTPSAKGIGSSKPTTININIENLVRELKVVTENLGMDKNKIAAEVSKLFLGVVNDANRLVGI